MTRNKHIHKLYIDGLPLATIMRRLKVTLREIEDAVDAQPANEPVTQFVEVLDPRALRLPDNVVIWAIQPPMNILASEIEVVE